MSALAGLALLAACTGDPAAARRCFVGADCASGVCLPDGTCAARGDADGPDGGDPSPGDAAPGDGGDASTPGDDVTPSDPCGCMPNRDRVLTAAEAPFRAGYQANFRVSTDVTGFSTAPGCEGDDCVWALDEVGGTTTTDLVATVPLAGLWFASDPAFADATYVTPLGEFAIPWVCSQTQLGVFQKTDSALVLLGVVSEREEDGTKLLYDPPVELARFPMQVGTTWTTETTATGPLCNSPLDYVIDQTYENSVDRAGRVVTPYGEFLDVLRVNTLFTRHLGLGVTYTTVRTHTFYAECFTTVALFRSEELETAAEFDDPAEVRRLAPFE